MKLLLNRDRAQRLDLEVSTMKSLARTGAAIIPIVDDYTMSEVNTDRPWYVMPRAEGGSLKDSIVPGQSYGGTLETALAAFGEIAGAVMGVHKNGVAHRDLKPANILHDKNKILLCDLGLCLPLSGEVPEERLTGELERIGSIHYTPKEAFGRRPLDQHQFALDTYALGKIFYELLSGNVLPGFTPPDDPHFDLHRSRGKPIYAGINSILRALLADSPEARLAALASLPARIATLRQWAAEDSSENVDAKLREKLLEAGERVARAISISPTPDVAEEVKKDCQALATEIMALWDATEAIKHIKEILIPSVPGALDLQRHPSTNYLRQLVAGPFAKTHSALEPLEDKGYPTRPAFEIGCALGILPKESAAAKLGQVWMGSIVCFKDNAVYAGFALARRNAGIDAYSDLIPKTAQVTKGMRGDPAFIKRALDQARTLPNMFVDEVVAGIKE